MIYELHLSKSITNTYCMIPFVKSSKIKLMFNERLWLSFRERGKAINERGHKGHDKSGILAIFFFFF